MSREELRQGSWGILEPKKKVEGKAFSKLQIPKRNFPTFHHTKTSDCIIPVPVISPSWRNRLIPSKKHRCHHHQHHPRMVGASCSETKKREHTQAWGLCGWWRTGMWRIWGGRPTRTCHLRSSRGTSPWFGTHSSTLSSPPCTPHSGCPPGSYRPTSCEAVWKQRR